MPFLCTRLLPELSDSFLASPVTPSGNSPNSYLEPSDDFPLILEHNPTFFFFNGPKLVTHIHLLSVNALSFSLGLSYAFSFLNLKKSSLS